MKEQEFLLKEYKKLWREHGVELPESRIPPSAPKPHDAGPVSSAPQETLEGIRNWIGDCTRCRLCEGRTHIVFGIGNPKTSLLFVGEGPGADEDTKGEPFVGRAGQLLTKIIEAMGFTRSQVYIANIVKCRPPQNRVPMDDEIAQCLPFLQAQIRVIQPKIIVALGTTATKALLEYPGPISPIRGTFQKLKVDPGIPVVPTYHPAYLLRNPAAKKIVWDDMKQVMKYLESTR